MIHLRPQTDAFYQRQFNHPHTPVVTVPGLNPMEFIGLRGRLEKAKSLDELAEVLRSVSEDMRNMSGSVVETLLGRLAPTPAGSLLQERPAALADTELAELKALMAKALPLPYVVAEGSEGHRFYMNGGLADTAPYSGNPTGGTCIVHSFASWKGEFNARFIAAACNALPALLAENARLRAASQPLELLGVPPTLSNPVYLPGGAEVTVEEMLQKIEGSLILSYGKQGDEAYNHLYSSVTYAVQVLRKQLAPAGLALSAASPSTIGGTPHARYPLGVSKQDLLDAANMVEGKGMKREASMMRSLIDEVEGLQESAAPSTIGGSGGASSAPRWAPEEEERERIGVRKGLCPNTDYQSGWVVAPAIWNGEFWQHASFPNAVKIAVQFVLVEAGMPDLPPAPPLARKPND